MKIIKKIIEIECIQDFVKNIKGEDLHVVYVKYLERITLYCVCILRDISNDEILSLKSDIEEYIPPDSYSVINFDINIYMPFTGVNPRNEMVKNYNIFINKNKKMFTVTESKKIFNDLGDYKGFYPSLEEENNYLSRIN